jgi:hypothetical protein
VPPTFLIAVGLSIDNRPHPVQVPTILKSPSVKLICPSEFWVNVVFDISPVTEAQAMTLLFNAIVFVFVLLKLKSPQVMFLDDPPPPLATVVKDPDVMVTDFVEDVIRLFSNPRTALLFITMLPFRVSAAVEKSAAPEFKNVIVPV